MALPRIGVLVSGGGRSLENLAMLAGEGKLSAEVALVICDREGAGALERAERLGIEARVLPWGEFASPEAFAARAFECLEEAGCELAVLAGFLRLLLVPDAWVGRVLNIHPALLPAFGGKGYYGERVHRAVRESGVWFTGCTVHYVTNVYDAGPILLQRAVEVEPRDTPESIAAKVFEEEKRALPDAIERHLSGRSRLEGERVVHD